MVQDWGKNESGLAHTQEDEGDFQREEGTEKKPKLFLFSFGSGEVALSQGNTSKKKSANAPETSRLEPQKNLTLQSPHKAWTAH